MDTYYDYEEKQWKSRRLGGGPIRRGPVCPAPRTVEHQADRRAAGREHGKDDKARPVLS
ncbi:hypothetical protein [Kribbella amoyensis]|uniref:hypothetical protein n=1 Tax=Kribbella amoyensis TaxID=996641 RepID=UPI001EE1DF9A|nr:hypothetical protein [Kribbella amoyensis]